MFQLALLIQFGGDKSKIDACQIKEYLESGQNNFLGELMERHLQLSEIILPIRIWDGSFRGMIDFEKTIIRNNATIDEWEKALVS